MSSWPLNRDFLTPASIKRAFVQLQPIRVQNNIRPATRPSCSGLYTFAGLASRFIDKNDRYSRVRANIEEVKNRQPISTIRGSLLVLNVPFFLLIWSANAPYTCSRLAAIVVWVIDIKVHKNCAFCYRNMK